VADGNRPLNYTTKIPARATAQECFDLLSEAGAETVAIRLAAKVPVGLSFRLLVPGPSGQPEPRNFDLPVNIDGMERRLGRSGVFAGLHISVAQRQHLSSREHATDVGWRVLRDWLEAQLAMIAAEMATLDEIMLPYLVLDAGGGQTRTLVEAYRASGYPEITS
jgi:hypothetical protein